MTNLTCQNDSMQLVTLSLIVRVADITITLLHFSSKKKEDWEKLVCSTSIFHNICWPAPSCKIIFAYNSKPCWWNFLWGFQVTSSHEILLEVIHLDFLACLQIKQFVKFVLHMNNFSINIWQPYAAFEIHFYYYIF